MYSTPNQNRRNRHSFEAFLATLAIAMLIIVGIGIASASPSADQVRGPLAQATTAPGAVGTVQVPDAVATGGAVPPAVATGGTGDSTNGSQARNTPAPSDKPSSGDPNANSDTAGNPGTTAPVASTSSGFPWLPVLVIVVLLALIALAFMMMRSRRSTVVSAPVAPTVAPVAPASPPAAPRTTMTTATTATTTTATPGVPAPASMPPATTVPGLAAAAAAPVASARTLTCPNCSTVNEWSENFCHECGQDLKPVRAGIIAASAPPADIVTDDMPYLETLDRIDDQLEYVLSRKKIVIGTAPGNDIVIDSSFAGSATVSPRHAELQREGTGFILIDLDSEHGTFVNDIRTGENLLAEGDRIRLGDVKFIYRVP